MTFLTHPRTKSGFSLIELMIAVAVIGIMASLVTLNLMQSRRNARDGIRKADAAAVLAAVDQFTQVNGNSLIKADVDGNGSPESCVTANNLPQDSANGTGCVGASGRSYGLINLKSATVKGSDNTPRTYPATSIVEALNSGGFFNVTPRDPSNTDGVMLDASGNLDGTPDYAMIRACANGSQYIQNRGQLFAIWVILERDITVVDQESLGRVPGYWSAAPAPVAPGTRYQYDFAAGYGAGSLEEQFESNGYGLSNGSSIPNSTAASDSCPEA